MAAKKTRKKQGGTDEQRAGSSSGIPAVPPPDDPMRRNEGEQGDVSSAEAAMLRAEAIRRTRLMPSDNDPLPPDKQR
jgi:hypothetical protein